MEFKLDRRGAAENRYRDREPGGVLVHLLDHAVEPAEWTVRYPHLIAGFELGQRPHSFSTCPNSSSTGVARPKMDTATFRRERPSSTSSTVPLKEANGPSDTRTCSPTSKVIEFFGRSIPSCTWWRMRCASASVIGIGLLSAPRKPVTFGVFLMR